MQCYELAVKSYSEKNRDLYKLEQEAFYGVRNQDGMVKYLGHYSFDETQPNGSIEKTYNILLEFGEMDLDQYFADEDSEPPVRTREINRFWESLFKVAKALKTFHNLSFEWDNEQTFYRG